jgi:Ser/Thr protein kinase RdoA (MazF antagonist)
MVAATTGDTGEDGSARATADAVAWPRETPPSIALDDAPARLLASPAPSVGCEEAEAALREHYGLLGRAVPLGGERDRNFMVTLDDGTRRVLKVYHEAEDPQARSFQHGAMFHMEHVGCACRVPRVLPTRDGSDECLVTVGGRSHPAVLISVVPGRPRDLVDASPALRRALGRTAAHVGVALADYRHPASRRVLLWDLMQVGRLGHLAVDVPEPDLRRWLVGVLDRFAASVRPRALALPSQVIHNDMSGSNVLLDGDVVGGLIDFGDVVWAPRVNEVAVLAGYCAARDPFEAIGDALEGYETVRPLDEAEVEALADLAAARVALRLLVYRWRAELFPRDRDRILRHAAAGRRLAAAHAALPAGAGRDAILRRWADRRRGA